MPARAPCPLPVWTIAPLHRFMVSLEDAEEAFGALLADVEAWPVPGQQLAMAADCVELHRGLHAVRERLLGLLVHAGARVHRLPPTTRQSSGVGLPRRLN
jgi:hypothetical protein